MTKYIFTRDLPPTNIKKGTKVEEKKHGQAMIATWLALGYIEEAKKEEWPKDGDTYYFVADYQSISFSTYEGVGDSIDRFRKYVGNFYRTEAEALEAKARVERAYKGI